MTERGPVPDVDSETLTVIVGATISQWDSTFNRLHAYEEDGCRRVAEAVIAARDAEWITWLTTTAGLDLRAVLGFEAGQREAEQRIAALEAELAHIRNRTEGGRDGD